MKAKQKRKLTRIIIALAMFILALVLPLEGWPEFFAFLAVYAVIGWDIVYRALRNILHGQIFDENFLMTVATIGALALRDAKEAVAVMMFYQVGEWFQDFAVNRSRRNITALMDIRPDHANLLAADGSFAEVSPEEVAVDDLILVKPGERVPLDGAVVQGASSLDTSALTGESLPRDIEVGGEVISGTVNLTGALTVKVARPYGESTVARILDLVESSGARKSKTENFITKFAKYYTPAVCAAALILAVIPPFVTGQPFGEWVYRALTFLVISCPCALVISIPLSFFGGIGGASKMGVLVKGSNYLEALSRTDIVVFDKTGTLTQGRFAVSALSPAPGVDEQKLLETAAYVESYSTHPIAQSVRAAFPGELDPARVSDVEELAGHGVCAVLDGAQILAGNAKLMAQNGIDVQTPGEAGTLMYLARDGKLLGHLLVEDQVREDAAEAVEGLRTLGVRKTVMLTGDADAVGQKVGAQLGLDAVYTQLLPADKVDRVEELLAEDERNGKLVFVGDGVNDAPVLARADVGVAMGGLGSDAAIEAADIVIMTDEPAKLPAAIRLSRKTMGIVWQNIIFALGIKAIVLLLGALGLVGMWAAVFADVGVAVIAILNAMRALRAVPAPQARRQPSALLKKRPAE